jgi:hypothetical protein
MPAEAQPSTRTTQHQHVNSEISSECVIGELERLKAKGVYRVRRLLFSNYFCSDHILAHPGPLSGTPAGAGLFMCIHHCRQDLHNAAVVRQLRDLAKCTIGELFPI